MNDIGTTDSNPFVSEQPPEQPEYRIGEWLNQAWSLFKESMLEFVAVILLMLIPGLIFAAIVMPLQFAYAERETNMSIFPLVPSGMSVLLAVVSMLVSAAVVAPYIVGAYAVTLNYTRTSRFDWGLILTGYRRWGGSFLLGLFPGGLFIIFDLFPYLYILIPIPLALYLWLTFAYLSLAERANYSQAVDRGLRLVTRNFWMAVLFSLVALALSVAGAIACCVGVLFTSAFALVLEAVAYDSLTRPQPPAVNEGETPSDV